MSEGFTYNRRDRRRRTSRWYAVLTVNGKRQFHAADPNTREAAKRLLADLQRERALGVVDQRDLMVGQFLQSWLTTVRPSLAPATWKQHESIIRLHLEPSLGHVRLSGLSVGDVRQWLSRPDGSSGQSRRHRRATLRRALADALREGLVTRNVAALAEPPKLDRHERQVLDLAQARRLIDGTRDDPYHALWVLAVTTGMRSAELLGLTWEDVDLEARRPGMAGRSLATVSAEARPSVPPVQQGVGRVGGGGGPLGGTAADVARSSTATLAGALPLAEPVVHVRYTMHWLDGKPVRMEPKTPKSRRSIALTPLAVEALDRHRRAQLAERIAAGKPGREGLVFVNRYGYAVRGENLSARLHRITDELGLPRVTLHDLRHSCATLLHSMGVPIEVIADQLGHSSTRVTADLYRHKVDQLGRDAAKKMQEAVAG